MRFLFSLIFYSSSSIFLLLFFSQENPETPPKVFDLSNELLSVGAVEAFCDILSVDFGCKKIVLESCGLDDEVSFDLSSIIFKVC